MEVIGSSQFFKGNPIKYELLAMCAKVAQKEMGICGQPAIISTQQIYLNITTR